jgi:hypothetical protein
MRNAHLAFVIYLLLPQSLLWGHIPFDKMTSANRILAEKIFRKPDFTFQTQTKPANVSLKTMENLFDRPRLAAAMWRECQFIPKLYAFVLPNKGLAVDDGNGLRGVMTLAYKKAGLRVYLIEGIVEKWRMGNPFPVSAKMVVVYKYKEDHKGFHSNLQTWTILDNAVLGIITKPFRSYIQHRQEEFISYIIGNIAKGGEFAECGYDDFIGPIKREGDPIAIGQIVEVFK